MRIDPPDPARVESLALRVGERLRAHGVDEAQVDGRVEAAREMLARADEELGSWRTASDGGTVEGLTEDPIRDADGRIDVEANVLWHQLLTEAFQDLVAARVRLGPLRGLLLGALVRWHSRGSTPSTPAAVSIGTWHRDAFQRMRDREADSLGP